MKLSINTRGLRSVEALLRHRYPGHDVFTRRVGDIWSAEVVAPGQQRPPYRTWIIAEADTPDTLVTRVKERLQEQS